MKILKTGLGFLLSFSLLSSSLVAKELVKNEPYLELEQAAAGIAYTSDKRLFSAHMCVGIQKRVSSELTMCDRGHP